MSRGRCLFLENRCQTFSCIFFNQEKNAVLVSWGGNVLSHFEWSSFFSQFCFNQHLGKASPPIFAFYMAYSVAFLVGQSRVSCWSKQDKEEGRAYLPPRKLGTRTKSETTLPASLSSSLRRYPDVCLVDENRTCSVPALLELRPCMIMSTPPLPPPCLSDREHVYVVVPGDRCTAAAHMTTRVGGNVGKSTTDRAKDRENERQREKGRERQREGKRGEARERERGRERYRRTKRDKYYGRR
ncbi:unnamed protein product [Laminaria digitata]